MNQQDPYQSIINYNGYQIVNGCDQRTGRNCRIDLDLMEEHRNQCSHKTGDHHSRHQRKYNAAGDHKCVNDRISLKQQDIKSDDKKCHGSQE